MPIQFVPKGTIEFGGDITELFFSGNAEEQELTFTANYDWRIISTQEWLTISPNEGEAGTNTVTISSTKSTIDEPRYAGLTFVIEHLREVMVVTQAKANMIYFKKSEQTVVKEGEDVSIDITHNIPFEIEVYQEDETAEPIDWIDWEVTSGDIVDVEGFNYATIMFTIDEQEATGYNPRSVTLRLYNEEVEAEEFLTFTQEPVPCIGEFDMEYSVSYEEQTIDVTIEDVMIEFDFYAGNPSQCTVVTSGTSDGGVEYGYDSSDNTLKFGIKVFKNDLKLTERINTITISNSEFNVVRTITVTQDEYTDDATIEVTAADQVATQIAAMDTSSLALTEYDRLFVKGATAALSTADFTAIKTNMPNLRILDISETATTSMPNTYNAATVIEEVVFPTTLTTIAGTAFNSSTSLKRVTIPLNVETCDRGAFGWCSALETVIIEEGVEFIGENAFIGAGVVNLTLPSTIERWNTDTSGNSNAFASCTSLKYVNIPEGVTSIGAVAFMDSGVEEVIIPGTITEWQKNTSNLNSAFSNCYYLTTLTLGDGLAEIAEGVFPNCYLLKTITSYSVTPPTISASSGLGINVGMNVSGGTTVYVPAEAVEAYEASNWARYKIEAIVDED